MPQSEFVLIRNLNIRYFKIEEGSKSPLVFFHGYSFSLRDWERIGTLEYFSKLGYPILALDLPRGKASKSDKVDSRDETILVLKEFFQRVGFGTKPFVIVGPSMGGGFAISYALSHPKEVEALVLVGPVLLPDDEERISELEIPILLVWGEKDDVFPPEEHARSLKSKLKRSKLIILKGGGHAAYLDKTEEFHSIMHDFLEEIAD